ncbi:FAD:protein FMN transferase [Catalinimonas sp. 4WD22]|uniref:FAD:protein FMN transferase n=1 Tax=Catalinimonas locisalis TaxID=3133978 RepID=UPI0031019187
MFKKILTLSMVFLLFGGIWYFTKKEDASTKIVVQGSTMGTTYTVTYFDEQGMNYKPQLDSILLKINEGVNTYDPGSEISRFNQHSRGVSYDSPHLYELLRDSEKLYHISQGLFDPSVMPLLSAWGFDAGQKLEMNDQKKDSIRQLIGFEQIQFTVDSLWKEQAGNALSFGGIAQGYAADVIATFLKQKGINHMLVEIGGEGIAQGMNLDKGQPWRIGILDPDSSPDAKKLFATVSLTDQAFTTSGNYFNYRIVDGIKYGHTMSPEKAEPVQTEILSLSIIGEDASVVDGWATAGMQLSVEEVIKLLEKENGLALIIIYSDPKSGDRKTYISSKLKESVKTI